VPKNCHFFKSSTIGTDKLIECQTQLYEKQLKLKQDVQTRWNSTYLMFQRLVEVTNSLIMCLSYVICTENLTAEEWDVLQECVNILKPLNELTEELSGEQY
jgi:hypothetical protein